MLTVHWLLSILIIVKPIVMTAGSSLVLWVSLCFSWTLSSHLHKKSVITVTVIHLYTGIASLFIVIYSLIFWVVHLFIHSFIHSCLRTSCFSCVDYHLRKYRRVILFSGYCFSMYALVQYSVTCVYNATSNYWDCFPCSVVFLHHTGLTVCMHWEIEIDCSFILICIRFGYLLNNGMIFR